MSKIDPFKTPDGKPISNAIAQWGNLSDRDFVVAGCAVMDANLTHLLLNRLADLPDVASNFLGFGDKIEGGGASTLSSKAELAALVGLITAEEVKYLKAFMRIRNHFAHRVVIDFKDINVVKELNKLKQHVLQNVQKEWKDHRNSNVKRLYRNIVDEGTEKIGETNQAGRNVFSWSRVRFETHFWQINHKNERVKTLRWFNLPKSTS